MLADDPLGAQRELISTPFATDYLEAFAAIESDPNNELIVATRDGVVLGMLQLTLIPGLSHRGGWRTLIEGVRVASGARSGGIGTAMIDWAVERARCRHCVMIQLTTDRLRTDALRFYERSGFVHSHHGMKRRV